MSVQPFFAPVRMGELDLPNRIVMAPLTRMRAGPIDHVPTALQAEYYAQQASAGLIAAEATAISPPITSCGKVEDNLPDRAAYLGRDGVRRPDALSPCIRGTLCLCRAAESFLATLSMVP